MPHIIMAFDFFVTVGILAIRLWNICSSSFVIPNAWRYGLSERRSEILSTLDGSALSYHWI